jgi:putative nucleotide binding protein
MPAKDDYAIVLDFLPHGKPSDRKSEALAQCLGDKFFNLLEVIIKEDITTKPKERIYIGEDKRDQVKYIRGRIVYDELTSYAKSLIEDILKELVEKNEERFVDFFNKTGSITTRLHSLELLPGIGKKHLWEIIEEKKKKPFENFEDLQKRVTMMPDPKKIIIKRIIDELEGKDRHRLFVASPVLG